MSDARSLIMSPGKNDKIVLVQHLIIITTLEKASGLLSRAFIIDLSFGELYIQRLIIASNLLLSNLLIRLQFVIISFVTKYHDCFSDYFLEDLKKCISSFCISLTLSIINIKSNVYDYTNDNVASWLAEMITNCNLFINQITSSILEENAF